MWPVSHHLNGTVERIVLHVVKRIVMHLDEVLRKYVRKNRIGLHIGKRNVVSVVVVVLLAGTVPMQKQG